jgi:hypothetical protein
VSFALRRDLWKLFAGQGASLFGSLISRLALPFLLIYTLSATPMDVAWVWVDEIAPGIMLGLLAGTLLGGQLGQSIGYRDALVCGVAVRLVVAVIAWSSRVSIAAAPHPDSMAPSA